LASSSSWLKGEWTLGLPQHPDEHRPQRPVVLAIDQELGKGATLRIAPELSDPVGSLEVGEHEDVEQLGAGSRTERVQAFSDSALQFVDRGAVSRLGTRSCPTGACECGWQVSYYAENVG
jgi:hypothetical protein